MRTQPVMISSNEANLLFDDRSLLEVVVGKDLSKVSSINTNCDCDGYYANPNDENLDTLPIPASAATLH